MSVCAPGVQYKNKRQRPEKRTGQGVGIVAPQTELAQVLSIKR